MQILSVRNLSLTCGLGLFLTINLCYLLAASNGHVAWCIPYWGGCSSISATGRQMPEALVFKGFMLPLALVIILFWYRAWELLSRINKNNKIGLNAMLILGLSAAIFLVFYTIILGMHGSLCRQLRHIGIILTFVFTFLAQLLLTRNLIRLSRYKADNKAYRICQMQMGICILLLSIGVASVLLEIFYTNYNLIEDAIEWNLALLLQTHYVLTYFICCHTLHESNGA